MNSFAEEILQAISNQRHDFLNHLQVIWGYLKLKKEDKALEYLLQVLEHLEGFRELNNIKSEKLAAIFTVNALESGNIELLKIKVPEPWLMQEAYIAPIESFCTEFFSLIKNNILLETGKINMELLKDRIVIAWQNKDENNSEEFLKILVNAAEKNKLLCYIEDSKFNIKIN